MVGQAPPLTLLLALSLQAQDPGPRFQFSGFGTLGVAATDTREAGFVRDLSQRNGVINQANGEVDSRLGVQFDYRFADELRGTVQVVSRYRYDGTFKPVVNLGYLAWNPVGDLQVRAGRLGFDQILGSESKDVGYSYLWVRPNGDVQGLNGFNSFNGLDVTGTFEVGRQTSVRVKAGLGRLTDILAGKPYPDWDLGGSTYSFCEFDLQRDAFQARLTLGRSRNRNEFPAVVPLISGIRIYATDLNDPRLDATADTLSVAGASTWGWQLSTLYDRGPVQFQTILTRRLGERRVAPQLWNGLASLGYRLGTVEPYLVFSRVAADHEPDPYLGVIPTLPDPTSVQLTSVALNWAHYQDLNRHTLAAGARWDFKPGMDLKAQVDQIRTHNSPSGFKILEPGWNGRDTVFTVTLDFVFGRGR